MSDDTEERTMKFSATCPVCGGRLEWEQKGEASWGIIDILDVATVSVTIVDHDNVVRAHMNEHMNDGSYSEARAEHVEQSLAYFRNLKAQAS